MYSSTVQSRSIINYVSSRTDFEEIRDALNNAQILNIFSKIHESYISYHHSTQT